jgi:hypothetical protein
MRGYRGWSIGLVAVLALAACTSEDPPPRSEPTRVAHPKAEVPKDRDEQAVVAALRKLDACALLDPAAIDRAGTKPKATGPHQCHVTIQGALGVGVTLGDRVDWRDKYDRIPVELSGAKAYLDPMGGGGGSTCRVGIPVSFELAISIFAQDLTDACGKARAMATVVASRLANPDAVAVGASADPLTTWDACALLAAGLGDNAEQDLRIFGGTFGGGLDRCVARESSDMPRPREEFGLALSSGPDPASDGRDVKTLGGTRVRVSTSDRGCSLDWSEGPDRVVKLTAPDCPRGEPVVEKLINAVRSAPPDSVAPQRPLVYRPDETDVPIPGACVNFHYDPDVQCQPSVAVPVPGGGAQAVFDAATSDDLVSCALAMDAVRTRFGPTMEPVVAKDIPGCHFVEPTHTVTVRISVTPNGELRKVVQDGRSETVADRPAMSAIDVISGYRMCLVPVAGAANGVLCLDARFAPGRGVDKETPADTGKSAQLQPVARDIVMKHFS